MEKSSTIKELAVALAKVQAEMPAAPFNSVNPFLKNQYADLGSIIETARPVLAKYGIAVSQHPVSDGDSLGLTTILMHSSGEWMESTIYLSMGEEKGKSNAQVAGSIISYLRRYSLAAVLGMYADQDTDANQPAKQQPAQAQQKPQAQKPAEQINPLKAAAVEAAKANGGDHKANSTDFWKRAKELGLDKETGTAIVRETGEDWDAALHALNTQYVMPA